MEITAKITGDHTIIQTVVHRVFTVNGVEITDNNDRFLTILDELESTDSFMGGAVYIIDEVIAKQMMDAGLMVRAGNRYGRNSYCASEYLNANYDEIFEACCNTVRTS